MDRRLRFSSTSNRDLLRDNKRHLFAAGHALRIFQCDAVYSYIPKNGCTALRYALAIANCCLSEGDDVSWVDKNNSTFAAGLSDLIRAKYTFIVLRCPFKRLASAFLDKVVGDHVRRARLLERAGISPNELTFRRFTELVTDKSIRRLDHHWSPQADFYVYQSYDRVFVLEEFDAMQRTLDADLGVRLYDVRNLVRHGLDQFTPVAGHFSDVPVEIIAAMRGAGKSPTAKSLYCPEIVHSVSTSYAVDIELHRQAAPSGSQLFQV